MDSTTFGLAVALVLVIEGFMPLVWPASWRKVLTHILHLEDGQLRFFGLCSVALGVLLMWLLP